MRAERACSDEGLSCTGDVGGANVEAGVLEVGDGMMGVYEKAEKRG